MKNQKISGIVAIYNGSRILKRTLPPILQQLDELIIIDDNSNDNTIELVKQLDSAKIRLIASKKNHGAGTCKNYGAKIAKYDLLFLFDIDLIFPDDYVQNLKKELTNTIACASGTQQNPMKSFSHKYGEVITRAKSKEFPKSVDGAYLIKKEAFLKSGTLKITCKGAGGGYWLFKNYLKLGYKIKQIEDKFIHLGEPLKIKDRIEREWTYGSRRYYYLKKNISLKFYIYLLIMMTPMILLTTYPYIKYVANNKQLRRDWRLVFGFIPFYYLDNLIYALAFYSSVLGFNKSKYLFKRSHKTSTK